MLNSSSSSHAFVKQAGNPELPIVINQLGILKRKNLSKRPKGGVWSVGFMREIQRRVAEADPHVHLVMTADLTLADRRIHFDRESHKEIGRRVGLALAGRPAGPLIDSVTISPKDPKVVLLRCKRVHGSLSVEDGWQYAVGISPAVELPASFSQWPKKLSTDKLLSPELVRRAQSAEVVDKQTIALTFSEPIAAGDLFHWCWQFGRNEEGDAEDSQPSLTGIRDQSGVTLAAAALIAIQ